MARQKLLPLDDQAAPEELWEQFPRESRRQVVTLYARLIARAAGSSATRITQEENEDELFADRSTRQDSR